MGTHDSTHTYDDKPCFDLGNAMQQAQEPIWQKNTILELRNSVRDIKEGMAEMQKHKELLMDSLRKVNERHTRELKDVYTWMAKSLKLDKKVYKKKLMEEFAKTGRKWESND